MAMILTADAIHNWDAAYVQKRYAHLSDAIKQACWAAMVRHHQHGSSAQAEADAVNKMFGLAND